MVAMAVLAIALTAVLSSQGRTMLVADVNDFTATSAHLGVTRLAEFLAEDERPNILAGKFEQPYAHYFWQFEVGKRFGDLDHLPEGAAEYLERIDLQVSDERRDQRFSMTRYRFGVDSP